MFKIIGGDGRQYGPVSADQIRQWVAEGRANAQTLAQAEGSVEWKPLGQYPEFAPAAPPPFTPPPTPPAATNRMAITGLVMGIIGITVGLLCCGPLFNLLGIIFSSVGLSQIDREPSRQAGKGVAIAGLVLSILGLILSIVIAIWSLRRGFGRYPIYWHFRQWSN